MAKTAESVLIIARKELGYKESPANSNRTKYGAWYGLDGNPWCVMFIQWCFYMAGALDLLPKRTASCTDLMNAAKKAGCWVTSGFQPGDVVLYNFDSNRANSEHVGIIESVTSNAVVAIEGNTATGNDANGGQVQRRTRKLSLVLGAVRPKWEAVRPASLVAQDVLNGKYGNGDARRTKLAAEGYDPVEVQEIVNLLARGMYRVMVTASALNVREKPDSASAKLDTLLHNAMVYISEVREGPGASAWGKASNGWISLDYTASV